MRLSGKKSSVNMSIESAFCTVLASWSQIEKMPWGVVLKEVASQTCEMRHSRGFSYVQL
jgi:hypothetical protein